MTTANASTSGQMGVEVSTYVPTYTNVRLFLRFRVPNKRVAVEPFPDAPKAEVKNGILQPMNRSALSGLRVVFGGDSYSEGTTVYVRTNLRNTTSYAKEVFEVDGRKFILIPEDEVLLEDRGTWPQSATLSQP